MGRLSREKGAGFEREVVLAAKAAGLHAERHAPLQANAAIGAADIVLEGVGKVECKRRARGAGTIYAAFENGADAVVFRADRKPALIIFELADWLIREGRGGGLAVPDGGAGTISAAPDQEPAGAIRLR